MGDAEFNLINEAKFDEAWETFLASDVFEGSPVSFSKNFFEIFII